MTPLSTITPPLISLLCSKVVAGCLTKERLLFSVRTENSTPRTVMDQFHRHPAYACRGTTIQVSARPLRTFVRSGQSRSFTGRSFNPRRLCKRSGTVQQSRPQRKLRHRQQLHGSGLIHVADFFMFVRSRRPMLSWKLVFNSMTRNLNKKLLNFLESPSGGEDISTLGARTMADVIKLSAPSDPLRESPTSSGQ